MAVKISVGGGQQIVPNAKEVLAKIKSTAYCSSNPPPYPVTSVNGKTGAVTVKEPVTKYVHYFAVDTTTQKLAFSIISADSPTSVANSPGTYVRRAIVDGAKIPCTGAIRVTIANRVVGVACFLTYTTVSSSYFYVNYGYSIQKVDGVAENKMEFGESSVNYSSVVWQQSIEI